MRCEKPVRCAKCYIRMEPNELQTVHYKRTYHQHCFVKLIRENAERETARPSEAPITGAVPLRFA